MSPTSAPSPGRGRWRPRQRGTLPLAVLVAVTAVVGLLAPGQLRLSWMVTGLGLYLLLLGWQIVRPPARPPVWARGWPIVVCFAAFAITRHGAGALASGFSPLAVLPVIGAGLHGRRRDIAIALTAGTITFGLPPLLDPMSYPPGIELRRAVLWLVADALIAITIYRLVASHRRHIQNLTLLASTSRDLSTAPNAREAICRVTAQICSADLVYLLEREDSTNAPIYRPPDPPASLPSPPTSPPSAPLPPLFPPPGDAPTGHQAPALTPDPAPASAPLPPRTSSGLVVNDHQPKHPAHSTGLRTSTGPRTQTTPQGPINRAGQRTSSPWLISTAAVGRVRGQLAPSVRIDTSIPSLTAEAFAGRRAGFVADVASEAGVSEAIRSGLDVASATWQPVGATATTTNRGSNDGDARGSSDGDTGGSGESGTGGGGLLIVVWHRRRDELDPATQAMLAALAADAAVAIERENLLARVQQAATHDALTGLVNRHHWDTTATHEVARAARDQQPLTFALIDLDHFKRYNDTRGHLAGDELLRGFSHEARRRLRDVDTFARWGGEEFAVAMPGCTADDALVVAERLHAAVPDGQTCTIGISQWRRGDTHHDALNRADEALYEGKNRRRGTTTVH